MNPPSITFFCELHEAELEKMFASNNLISQLSRMNANVSMALHEFSPERVKVVKKLTKAGIPVTAWLLLSPEEGYWTSLDTIHQTQQKYLQFRAWSEANQLTWAAIGLDIEPRIDTLVRLNRNFPGQIPNIIKRFFSFRKYRFLEREAQTLIDQIHDDGYAVETYQFPTVIEERRAGSSVLARVLGLPALKADREVLMLYSSVFPMAGHAILWSYAQDASAVGVGSTGGGVSITGLPPLRKLRWLELKRDLLIAHQHASHVYIFSLEGCLEENMLDRLETLDWDTPQSLPQKQAHEITLFRKVTQSVLWMFSNPVPSFLISFSILSLLYNKKSHGKSKNQ